MTVGDVFRTLVRHPVDRILRRWNWKAAVLSGGIRGAIFFFANLTVSSSAAVDALLVDLSFRVPMAGIYAALTQSFEFAEPAWAASLAAMVMVPAIAHSIEFGVHWAAGTQALAASVMASIAFSALSTVFNLFAMRRGALVVGDHARPLHHDLRRMPAIVAEFLLVLPMGMHRIARAHVEDTTPGRRRETTAPEHP